MKTALRLISSYDLACIVDAVRKSAVLDGPGRVRERRVNAAVPLASEYLPSTWPALLMLYATVPPPGGGEAEGSSSV